MASFRDLELDWSMLCQDCTDCWTAEDLQLAAELGKTLLERNKELEIALKHHQNVIDDQAQEIEYLTKQTVALREVSDSRLKIYEQLEVSIQDLERANHRLVFENSAGKKHIKSLTMTIEGLESKCEDLQTTIDDLRLQVDSQKRRARPSAIYDCHAGGPPKLRHIDKYEDESVEDTPNDKCHTPEESSRPNHKKTEPHDTTTSDKNSSFRQQEQDEVVDNDGNMEQMAQVLAQLRETKTQAGRDQRRISELEEQLSTMVQQNQALENQVIHLHHRDDDMKSMYDELSTLEEVRKGQMCSRCLRSVERNSSEDLLEDDDSSMLEELMNTSQHRASFTLNVQEHVGNQSSPLPNKEPTGNLYKDLVEKYEALLDVHRQPSHHKSTTPKSKPNRPCVSLQEELQMSGDFNTHNRIGKDTDDDESGNGDSLKPEAHNPIAKTRISRTPTDFSEAETSSSGFSDETSNKYTQTEDKSAGSSFLCTIADGDDKFSIYDATSPISSRFKNQPEYQELFKEIFSKLKSEPMTKIEDMQPKLYPRNMELMSKPSMMDQMDPLDDDSQSVVSSTMSELSISQNEQTTVCEDIIQSQNQPIPEATSSDGGKEKSSERVLKPLVRAPLEYLSVEVRKRSKSRRNKYNDRSDSPVTHIIGSPKINYSNRPNSGRRRREQLFPKTTPEAENVAWNGNSIQFWSSNGRNLTASPTPSQGSGKFEFRPSLASQELHKLKKLDLSYAEVVRKADNKKNRQRRKQ